jgi:hypothetical protein
LSYEIKGYKLPLLHAAIMIGIIRGHPINHQNSKSGCLIDVDGYRRSSADEQVLTAAGSHVHVGRLNPSSIIISVASPIELE